MSRHIKAAELKAKCLALMDEVARPGIAVIITKNGKPVAELVPHRPRKAHAAFSKMNFSSPATSCHRRRVRSAEVILLG